VASLLLAAAGSTILAGCRQDMHNQPKFIPLRSSEFFSDRRSARYPIPGTVSRLDPNDVAAHQDEQMADEQQLDPNSYYLTGKHGQAYGNELPLNQPLKDVLARGQQRYNIYCTPCHSMLGDGNGMIVQRGYKRPPSFHLQRLRNAPLGYFYDIIGNGFGGMPDYAAQVHPADRWAIAVYIRALQRSQNASDADVPAEDRAKLNQGAQEIRIPDTSLQNPASTTPTKPVAQPTPKGDIR
jgi:mono/diheme cytochrome c family protein